MQICDISASHPDMKAVLFIMCISFAHSAFSQGVARLVKRSVGLVRFVDKSTGGIGMGTGTLILKREAKDSVKVILITNRHVLPSKSQSDSIHFVVRGEADNFSLIIPIFDKSDYHKNVRVDPDGNDLVAINVSDFFSQHHEIRFLLDYMLTDSFLATSETIQNEQIEIGDEIFFIGFPSMLYDKRNVSPLVRTGIIATDPDDQYYFSDEYRAAYFDRTKGLLPEKLDGFLIDANAFGGSSGSLVLTKPRIMRLKDGKVQFIEQEHGQFFVLGILTNSYFDVDSRLPATQRINLGGVVSASQILKTIDLF